MTGPDGQNQEILCEVPLVGPRGRGLVARVDAADYELVAGIDWYAFEARAARHQPLLYARGRVAGRRLCLMHRLILRRARSLVVDHIDCDGLNNSRANLRACTRAENSANRRNNASPNRTSEFKGVSRVMPDRWVAHFNRRHLGTFRSERDAARAFDAAAYAAHGEFARLNFEVIHEAV